MTRYSKFNLIYKIQKWIDSVPGQTFLNYAYSWGASIVILGTLFKLTHLPGANVMLYIGMGTEVIVFFISAFDRPFDKTAIDMELPTHYVDEEAAALANAEHLSDEIHITEFAPVTGTSPAGGGVVIGGGIISGGAAVAGGDVAGGAVAGGTVVGGVISGGVVSGGTISGEAADGENVSGASIPSGAISGGTVVIGGGAPATDPTLGAEVAEATGDYIEQLQKLTEVLSQVSEQSQRLTRDSEEMENLNRTLTGISRVYEMQLKSASQQIGTIDEINDQTKHLAEQIQELNKIYARMIEAMTTNGMAGKANA